MITEDRLKHMLGVARECYALAKSQRKSEDECRNMFLMGFIHDIGYEFVDEKSSEVSKHGEICANIVDSFTIGKETIANVSEAIRTHGYPEEVSEQAYEYAQILNYADNIVDGKGNKCSIEERRKDTLSRWREDPDINRIMGDFDKVCDMYKLNELDAGKVQ